MNTTFPYGIETDDEVARVYELAARIGAKSEGREQWSFTTVLLALLVTDLPLGVWFQGYVSAEPKRREKIARSKDLTWAAVKKAAVDQGTIDWAQRWTPSAREVFLGSVMLAERVGRGSGRVGLRHVMGAYCAFHYPNHEAQIRRWGFEPATWFPALIQYLDQHSTDQEELERWKQVGEEFSMFGRPDSISDPNWLRVLRTLLAKLFPDERIAKLVVADAGIDLAHVDFSGSAEVMWFGILGEANRSGILYELLESARRIRPESTELERLT